MTKVLDWKAIISSNPRLKSWAMTILQGNNDQGLAGMWVVLTRNRAQLTTSGWEEWPDILQPGSDRWMEKADDLFSKPHK